MRVGEQSVVAKRDALGPVTLTRRGLSVAELSEARAAAPGRSSCFPLWDISPAANANLHV